LSVDFNVAVPDGCATGLTGKKAIVSLHVGRVRDVPPLDVVPDEPTHANIINVPFYSSLSLDERQLAEQLATKLVEQARTVWLKSANA
jgi:hypothetical protein